MGFTCFDFVRDVLLWDYGYVDERGVDDVEGHVFFLGE